MSIPKVDGFVIYRGVAIDGRFAFATIGSRNALAPSWRYQGLISHVVDSDGAGNPALYCLMTGIDNADWIEIAGSSGSARVIVTVNQNAFVGIEAGANIYDNPKGTGDIIVQTKDANGQVLPINAIVDPSSPYEITIYSGYPIPNARIVII